MTIDKKPCPYCLGGLHIYDRTCKECQERLQKRQQEMQSRLKAGGFVPKVK